MGSNVVNDDYSVLYVQHLGLPPSRPSQGSPRNIAGQSVVTDSGFGTYTGSAKTFFLVELEKAADKFKLQNDIGEEGFGRVCRGMLEDQTKVAIKVLTRDDEQGYREFVAEVEWKRGITSAL